MPLLVRRRGLLDLALAQPVRTGAARTGAERARANMPAPEDLPAEIRDLTYRNGFELSHNRWESDVGQMVRRLDLDGPAGGHHVKPIALEQSGPEPSGSRDISAAPAIPRAKPQRELLRRRVRLTRR
jgi:hypothetical protein